MWAAKWETTQSEFLNIFFACKKAFDSWNLLHSHKAFDKGEQRLQVTEDQAAWHKH